MKFLKNLLILQDGEGWVDFALIIILWLAIGIGGLFTISVIGCYLLVTNLVLGEILGGSILTIGLIELYCYRISASIDNGKKQYNR